MQSLVFGSAFEVESQDDETINARIYRYGSRTFLGHESFDIFHTCNETCTAEVIRDSIVKWSVASNNTDAYLALGMSEHKDDKLTYVPTIDVGDFDRGDDTYILCANPDCKTELYRDDEAHESMYGTPITTTTDIASDDNQGRLV